MKTFSGFAVAAALSVFLTACGPTVGDPCTTVSECGSQMCLNDDRTPGGYCSRQCTFGDDTTCPNGSTCIEDGAGKYHACYKVCSTENECRTGYVCDSVRGSGKKVCVGPSN